MNAFQVQGKNNVALVTYGLETLLQLQFEPSLKDLFVQHQRFLVEFLSSYVIVSLPSLKLQAEQLLEFLSSLPVSDSTVMLPPQSAPRLAAPKPIVKQQNREEEEEEDEEVDVSKQKRTSGLGGLLLSAGKLAVKRSPAPESSNFNLPMPAPPPAAGLFVFE